MFNVNRVKQKRFVEEERKTRARHAEISAASRVMSFLLTTRVEKVEAFIFR